MIDTQLHNYVLFGHTLTTSNQVKPIQTTRSKHRIDDFPLFCSFPYSKFSISSFKSNLIASCFLLILQNATNKKKVKQNNIIGLQRVHGTPRGLISKVKREMIHTRSCNLWSSPESCILLLSSSFTWSLGRSATPKSKRLSIIAQVPTKSMILFFFEEETVDRIGPADERTALLGGV